MENVNRPCLGQSFYAHMTHKGTGAQYIVRTYQACMMLPMQNFRCAVKVFLQFPNKRPRIADLCPWVPWEYRNYLPNFLLLHFNIAVEALEYFLCVAEHHVELCLPSG